MLLESQPYCVCYIKTDAQKTQEEKYKDQLRQQIEDRKRQKEIEQQKEKEEEAR